MKFQPTPRKIIIRFKNLWNDEKDGIKLDTTYKPEHHIRISAEVVAVPKRFEGGIINQHYEGSPAPRNYSSKRKDYQLYYHETPFYDVSDAEMDVRVGDTVYFHYLAIDYEQFERESKTYIIRDEEGYEYHQIAVEMLFCTVRDNTITPLLGKVFVEQIVQEEQNIGGFIIPKNDKYLEGIVKHVGFQMPSEERDIKAGDKVIYLEGAQFDNVIEDEEYYIMQGWTIAAKEVDGVYEPVGNVIKVELTENDHGLLLSDSHTPMQMNGTVISMGENCENNLVGDSVVFNNRSSYFVKFDEKTIFVRERDIYYIKNGREIREKAG